MKTTLLLLISFIITISTPEAKPVQKTEIRGGKLVTFWVPNSSTPVGKAIPLKKFKKLKKAKKVFKKEIFDPQKSIVDYLKDKGFSSTRRARKGMALDHGIENYRGSEKQNIELLKKLREELAIKTSIPVADSIVVVEKESSTLQTTTPEPAQVGAKQTEGEIAFDPTDTFVPKGEDLLKEDVVKGETGELGIPTQITPPLENFEQATAEADKNTALPKPDTPDGTQDIVSEPQSTPNQKIENKRGNSSSSTWNRPGSFKGLISALIITPMIIILIVVVVYRVRKKAREPIKTEPVVVSSEPKEVPKAKPSSTPIIRALEPLCMEILKGKPELKDLIRDLSIIGKYSGKGFPDSQGEVIPLRNVVANLRNIEGALKSRDGETTLNNYENIPDGKLKASAEEESLSLKEWVLREIQKNPSII